MSESSLSRTKCAADVTRWELRLLDGPYFVWMFAVATFVTVMMFLKHLWLPFVIMAGFWFVWCVPSLLEFYGWHDPLAPWIEKRWPSVKPKTREVKP